MLSGGLRISLELFSFKLLSSFELASCSCFAFALVWLVASIALAFSDLIWFSSERKEAVVVWSSSISLELFSFKLLSSLELASCSCFAFALAWLVASIALAFSDLIWFSSERKEAVVVWRSSISLELFSFKLLSSFKLASCSCFAFALVWLVASIALAFSDLIWFSSERKEAVVVWSSSISLELFSFKLLSSFELASCSCFAFALAWLVASIALAFSDLIWFSSERKEAVVVWRSLNFFGAFFF